MGSQRRWLRLLREQRGFTQRQLATVVGVAPGTIARWERGDSTPRPDAQARMATPLDMSREDLAALFTSARSPLLEPMLQRPVLLPAVATDRDVYVLQLAIRQLQTMSRATRSTGIYVVTRSAILRWACALLQVDSDPRCRAALQDAITALRKMPGSAICQAAVHDQTFCSVSTSHLGSLVY